MDLFLIRHGETLANLQKRWQGQTDAPLSPLGQAQARALGERIASLTFDARVSSDLGRAVATSSLALGEVELDAEFREASVGQWEGLQIGEVIERYPEQMRALMDGELDVRLGGGETLREFHARLDRGVARLFERFGAASRVAVMSHGGSIAALVARVLGTRSRPAAKSLGRLSNTSITVLRIEHPADRGRLLRFNDAHHLDRAEPLRSPGDIHDAHVVLHADSEAHAPETEDALAPLFEAKMAAFERRSLNALATRISEAAAESFLPLEPNASLRLIREGGSVRLADYNVVRRA